MADERAFSSVADRIAPSAGPSVPGQLGFVLLGEDDAPREGTSYPIVAPGDAQVLALPAPTTETQAVDLNLLALFAGNLPDVFGRNEGLLRVAIDTRNPQNLDETQRAGKTIQFEVADGAYSPGFEYRGVYRNIVTPGFFNLSLELYEMDQDVSAYYDRVTKVIDGVPELRELDVVKAIPYLDVATKLFDGLIRQFGKNPDDHLWGEVPLLAIEPAPGSAALRSGIYIMFDRAQHAVIRDLYYRDAQVMHVDRPFEETHLVMSIGVRPR